MNIEKYIQIVSAIVLTILAIAAISVCAIGIVALIKHL